MYQYKMFRFKEMLHTITAEIDFDNNLNETEDRRNKLYATNSHQTLDIRDVYSSKV